ncbi:hypothetical protein [Clostridium septicum]|uniref:DNA-directed RNA polymerase subunit P n=1 Tax=Clostridium septicum TaxID=1504 RepID=A0ABY5B2Y5_CLOSE|nr:hypothetical protein [Clostridium septicum]MDU1314574.1 hypothetical protein [Clostridium septicum]UEC19817.1 hypothetical protein LK444_10375 [Clostridium septicum]USS02123.1 hypothetical protein NH397_06790 [Clostridium septicum]WLF70699.1 hypothetical protein Q6375_06875 [Clostridium septicum]
MAKNNLSFQCNKCGHILNSTEKNSLVMCPECKNIKKVENFNYVEG